jgi:hypothetical protein
MASDKLSSYRRKPRFIERSYFSLIYHDLIKIKPLKALKRVGTKFLYQNSEFARHVIENPGGEEALYDIYDFTFSSNSHTLLNKILLDFRACRATRQRKIIYQNILKEKLFQSYRTDKSDNIQILELGSGRGSILINSVSDLCRNTDIQSDKIHVTLVDRDEEALERGRSIITLQIHNLSFHFNFKQYNAKNVCNYEEPEKYDIVGTHGLLDYFSDEEAIKLFTDISKVLIPGGTLITTNMIAHDDWKARFIMETFCNWRLKYRTPSEFTNLIKSCGKYEITEIVLACENNTYPLSSDIIHEVRKGFHTIISARKS